MIHEKLIEPMLIKCWPSVGDNGPTFNQHWFSVSCFSGIRSGYKCIDSYYMMCDAVSGEATNQVDKPRKEDCSIRSMLQGLDDESPMEMSFDHITP